MGNVEEVSREMVLFRDLSTMDTEGGILLTCKVCARFVFLPEDCMHYTGSKCK